MSILRIEPVRAGRDDAPYECVAENGVGDAVSAEATLTVYEGTYTAPYARQQPQSPGLCPLAIDTARVLWSEVEGIYLLKIGLPCESGQQGQGVGSRYLRHPTTVPWVIQEGTAGHLHEFTCC